MGESPVHEESFLDTGKWYFQQAWLITTLFHTKSCHLPPCHKSYLYPPHLRQILGFPLHRSTLHGQAWFTKFH